MGKEFGRLTLREIREAFTDEISDFTPWLAEEENMAELSSALGVELELENTEVSVGPYWADILAKDAGTGRYVVIENQLAKTNHDHLGKAITYAGTYRQRYGYISSLKDQEIKKRGEKNVDR